MATPSSSTPELEHEELAVSVPLLPSSSPVSPVSQSFMLDPPCPAHAARSNSGFDHVPSPLSRPVDQGGERSVAMALSGSNSISALGRSPGLGGSLGGAAFPGERSRGSMILYRFADEADFAASSTIPGPVSQNSTLSSTILSLVSDPSTVPLSNAPLTPPAADSEAALRLPVPRFSNHALGLSENRPFRNSIMSLSEDESKYPSMYGLAGAGLGLGMSATKAADIAHAASNASFRSEPSGKADESVGSVSHTKTLIPYLYVFDTEDIDLEGGLDEMENSSTDPEPKKKVFSRGSLAGGRFPWRGLQNVTMLLVVMLALLVLFIGYPLVDFFVNNQRNLAISENIQINGTGQAPVPVFPNTPTLVDAYTPDAAKSRIGYDGEEYDLVFSDEFEVDGRTFYAGDDPFWEAQNFWYGATSDLEWYDPRQVTTRGGALVITMDSADTTQSKLTPNSSAPFTLDGNHNLTYRSGMLQSWNKFCFSSGYIEVAIVLPGPDENTQGYWPGAWTMGNLGRPGFEATTDGMWPYSYDSCDVGTFPNQTYKDGSGPAAALHSDQSRPQYNYELSWLSGQRLSSCTCPPSSSYAPEHPGPFRSSSQSWLGRGAPEIDILEAEKDKTEPTGQVVSQSAQFAPFTHDYQFTNDTDDEFKIWDTSQTRLNGYHGSAVQQAVSSLSKVPSTGFEGSGTQFVTYGFEYFSDASSRSDGFITWQVNDAPTARLSGSAVGPDTGSQVGQRLISEEPMSIVLNLGISHNWQTIDLSTMQFPAEMLVDYVRVYQRKGHINVGCDPEGYPTMDYIANHPQAYTNVNATSWMYEKPKNSEYDGC